MSQVHRTPQTLRQTNIEARRKRILDAARRLIAAGGMSALSMRKLAAEAGLSVTTLYNLYGVRDEILHALVGDAVEQIVAVLDAEAPLADPLERCRAVITVSIRHFARDEAIYRPMIVAQHEALARGRGADRRIAKIAAGMQREGIEQAIATGLLSDALDPQQLGEQIYHGYEFACLQWAFGAVDEAGFRARALYGLYVALLAVASDGVRPRLESELHDIGRQLSALAEPATDDRPEKRSA